MEAPFSISSECKTTSAGQIWIVLKKRGVPHSLVNSVTLYTAKVETDIQNYLLNGRNISGKFLEVLAFKSQKGDEIFFFLAGKGPQRA